MTLQCAIKQFKFDIAKCDYGGVRYIKDKQAIADSLNHHYFTNSFGAISDSTNGTVWAVYLRADGTFVYSKILV